MRFSFKSVAIVCGLTLLPSCSMSMFGSTQPKTMPTSAAADTTKVASAHGLNGFDEDGDNQLTHADFEKVLAGRFQKEDTNKNGSLDADEVRSLNEEMLKEPDASPVIDWNADGKIAFAEFASQWRTMFERADINRDKFIDAEEMAGRVRERKPRPLPQPSFSGKDGRPPGS